jgi:hypothetical protein
MPTSIQIFKSGVRGALTVFARIDSLAGKLLQGKKPGLVFVFVRASLLANGGG